MTLEGNQAASDHPKGVEKLRKALNRLVDVLEVQLICGRIFVTAATQSATELDERVFAILTWEKRPKTATTVAPGTHISCSLLSEGSPTPTEVQEKLSPPAPTQPATVTQPPVETQPTVEPKSREPVIPSNSGSDATNIQELSWNIPPPSAGEAPDHYHEELIPAITRYQPPTTPPRIASSRFVNNNPGGQTDVWNPHLHQDRVVLPPLSSAVDNGLTPSRRTSMASPSTYSNQGSYNYSNTFESQRPPTASSVTSPVMNNVRVDISGNESNSGGGGHGVHPYRRPHMASRSRSAIVGGRVNPGAIVTDMAPRMAYNDGSDATNTQQLSWNIPLPSAGGAPDSARSSHQYNAYGDYSNQDFGGNLTTAGDGTPQSPSFAFTSSAFTPPGQPSAMFAMAGQRPSAYTLQSGNATCQPTPPASNASTSSTLIDGSQTHTPTPVEEELSQLRTKVRELEFVNDLVQLRVVELENERAKILGGEKPSSDGSSRGGLGLNLSPMPEDFMSSWEQRTEARIKRFCSLNRAGNALCAWHDSRRERRAYPPRMAPPGTLNCGCTFEEALFEESLSRHRVGSYLPGETVRMDPALRNPLLKVLQRRYGYKDGDFERDPSTGRWVEGEGEIVWQQKASSGTGSRRKQGDGDSQ